MNNRILFALAAVVLGAVGFLLYQGVSEPETAEPIQMPTESPAPAHAWPDAHLAGDGLQFAIITPGSGTAPLPEQLVEVSWKGWVKSTETQFADTAPKRFVLNKSPAVEGINQFLPQMKPGETRLLQLPAGLAYGQTGDPPTVPRDAEVMMLVTLHSVADVVAAPDQPSDATADAEVGGVRFAMLRPGTGAQPKAGDRVKIHISTFLEGGKRIDSTYQRHAPITVTVGKGELYTGLDRVLPDMKIGEKRKLIVPPELGAGSEGRGPIPPNSTLIFELELLSIE